MPYRITRLALALIALPCALFLALSGEASAAAPTGLTPHPDCTLKVPAHPLTPKGLATPYVLSSAGMTCHEGDNDTAAFVQATILNPATGAVSVYAPVVRDDGAALVGPAPPVPVLPRGAVVTIWTGFNGETLKLTGPGHDEFANFQQQGYANSIPFFAALYRSIRAGKTTVPPLGTSPKDGRPCPSARDFSIVDQDQSDNNPQAYPAYGVRNASDERIVGTVDAALGCAPWTAPSLDPAITGGAMSPSGPLQEAQAQFRQGAPVALIPGNNPFAMRNGKASLALQNLLRAEVGQRPALVNGTRAYCVNLAGPSGEGRLKLDAPILAGFPATNPIGDNLANQLAARFVQTWTILGCQALTGRPSPVQVTVNDNGTATSATYA